MSEGNLPQPPMFGLGKLNLGGGIALKPRTKPEKITDYKLDQFLHHRGKNSTERLRELDKIHMYTPLPDEVELLNVTPYRMNLLVIQDVMYLCGGLVGVRFSSEELSELLRLTKGMSELWSQISKIFQDMPTSSKKLTLSVDPEVETESVEGVEQVRMLHQLADQYVTLFGELQIFIKEKQKGVDPSTRTDAPKLEADPESKMGRSLPEWLSTLIEKHQRTMPVAAPVPAAAATTTILPPATALESDLNVTPDTSANVCAPWPHPEPVHHSGAVGTTAKVRTSRIKVGELSVYLSGCMTGLHPCTPEEQEAIAVLVQASNDTIMPLSNSEISAASGSSSDSGSSGGGGRHSPGLFSSSGSCTPRSRRYWAKRFYNFLSKLTELATAIKDEAALDAM